MDTQTTQQSSQNLAQEPANNELKDTNSPSEVLRFWRAKEFFAPFLPQAQLLDENALPWTRTQDTDCEYAYHIYLGCARLEYIQQTIETALGQAYTTPLETNNSYTFIASLTLDAHGHYIADSFHVTPLFCLAVACERGVTPLQNVNVVDLVNGTDQEFNTRLIKTDRQLRYPDLRQFARTLFDAYHPLHETRKPTILVEKVHATHAATTQQGAHEYTQGLDEEAIQDNNLVAEFIAAGKNQAFPEPAKSRALAHILDPGFLPLGMWDQEQNPDLMEQVALNALNNFDQLDSNIFSVAGAKGCGKTEVIKGVIAQKIVARAQYVSQHADTLFERHELNEDHDDEREDKTPANTTWYQVDQTIAKDVLLLTSSDRSSYHQLTRDMKFCGTEEYAERPVTFTLENEARLDVTLKELDSLYSRARRHEKPDTLLSFEEAKKRFDSQLDEVLRLRVQICDGADAIALRKETEEALAKAQDAHDAALKDLNNITSQIADNETQTAQFETEKTKLIDDITKLHNSLGAIKRTLSKKISFKDDTSQEIARLKTTIIELSEQIEQLKTKHAQLDSVCAGLQKRYDDCAAELADVNTQLEDIDKKIDTYADQFSSQEHNWVIADDAFFANLPHNEKAYESNVWVSEIFNKERKKLVRAAQAMLDAFFFENLEAQQNIHMLHEVLASHVDDDTCIKDIITNGLATLSLISPAIVASRRVFTLLSKHIHTHTFGLILFDQAEQMRPHSVVGGLLCAERACFIGNPYNLLPKATTLPIIEHHLATRLNINPAYLAEDSDFDVSALSFARRLVSQTEHKLVTCDLVLHRGSLSPMFDIADALTLHKRVFNLTPKPQEHPHAIERTCWIDAFGQEKEPGSRYVTEQAIEVRRIIDRALQIYSPRDVFNPQSHLIRIVSPFTSVVNALRQTLCSVYGFKFADYGFSSRAEFEPACRGIVGTVRDFQNIQAQEVILVLGCDNTHGLPSASWIANHPRYMSVAALMATSRLAIIGEKRIWNYLPNIDHSIAILDDFEKQFLEAENKQQATPEEETENEGE